MAHVELNQQINSTLIYIRSYSYYDKDKKKRVINKKDITQPKISENTVGRSKNSIYSDLKKLKNENILVQLDKQTFEVMEPQPRYVAVPYKFLQEMLKTFNDQTINVYL